MSYRYTIGEKPDNEIRRILNERFNRSIYEFTDPENSIEHANHQMRKNMKKVRAALRLVRDTIGENDYKHWNILARDSARMGAELRESKVLVATLEDLNNRFNWKINDGFYKKAHSFLVAENNNLTTLMLEKSNYKNRITGRLKEVQNDTASLTFDEESFYAFKKGLKRVYKRGRKACKKAKKKSTFKNHHEWRKRVKYLWYQIRILKDIWPEGLKGYAGELHNLSDLLGDDHDLYDLKNRLHTHFDTPDYKIELTAVDALISNASQEKREKAWPLGEKLYAENPKKFVKRFEAYWDVAHQS